MHLRKGILAVALLALIASRPSRAATPLQSSVQTKDVLTNRAIVSLAGAGFNEDFLIELIRNSKTQFDTTVEGLVNLAKQGITERIIRAMLNSRAMLQSPDAAKAWDAPFPATPDTAPAAQQITRIVTVKPEPETIAISSHTPYETEVSLFWGFYRKRTGLGVSQGGPDLIAPHLGAVYGAVLTTHAAP